MTLHKNFTNGGGGCRRGGACYTACPRLLSGALLACQLKQARQGIVTTATRLSHVLSGAQFVFKFNGRESMLLFTWRDCVYFILDFTFFFYIPLRFETIWGLEELLPPIVGRINVSFP